MEAYSSGEGGGYNQPEGVYRWGSNDKGWLVGLQQHDGEGATQAMMLQLVERDFAQ